MGISRGGARLIMEEARFWPFQGKLLQLGRQHTFLGADEFDSLATLHSIQTSNEYVPQNARTPLQNSGYIDDGSFFAKLGFSSVESMDFSNDEKPTYVHDLNQPIEESLRGRFDTIYDGGTMEHVFDVRSVLKNIFDMLKIGGRIIHQSPSSNHVDHGFYMFSPTLFYDFYCANNFKIHECLLIEYSVNHNDEPWSIYEYEPGCLSGLSFGGFDRGKLLAIYITAEKTEDSTWDKLPQQNMYAKSWSDRDVSLPAQQRIRSRLRWKESQESLRGRVLRAFRAAAAAPSPIPNKIAEF